MAAPVLVGTPGAAVASPDSVPFPITLTPSTGSGYVAGDLLLCFTASWWGNPASVDTPSGWVTVLNVVSGNIGRIALFAKVAASASEPAPSVVWNPSHGGSSGDPAIAIVAAFRGADVRNLAALADVIGAVSTVSSSFSQSAGGAGITTPNADDLVLSLTARPGGSSPTTLTAPSGFTLITPGAGTTSGNDMIFGWARQAKAVPGAVGTAVFGFNGQTNSSMGVMVSLKAAPVGIINNDVATGAIVFTGTLVEALKRAFNDAPSGPLALSGTSVDKSGRGFVDSPAGSLAFTASLVESFRRAFFDARTGALPLSGTAVDSWSFLKDFYDAPVGTFAVAGTSKATYARKDAVSGGFALAGSVVEHPGYGDKPVGTIRLWDWAAEHPPNIPRPVGIPGALATSVLRPDPIHQGNVANPTVLRPSTGSGYAVGDLLICFAAISIGGNNPGVGLVSASSGWAITSYTPVPGTGGAIAHRLYLVTKLAESLDEPSPMLTFNATPGTAGSPSMARIVAFKGIDTRDMASIFDAIGGSDVFTGPTYATGGRAITTVLPNDLVITLSDILDDDDPHIVQPSTGFTMLSWDAVDSGRSMQGGWAYQVKRTPGLVASPFFTISGTQNNISGGIQFAFKAARLVGTFLLSGSVQERRGRVSSVAGAIKLLGSLVESKVYVDKPQGTLAVAGSVVELYKPSEVAGTLPLTGTVQERWSHVSVLTGRLTFSGSVVEERYFSDLITGSLAVIGTSKDNLRRTNVCKAVLKLAGVVSEGLALNVSPHGVVRLTGIKSESITIDETTFYDDFPGGLLEIDGKTVFVNYAPEPGRPGRVVSGSGPGRIVRGSDTGRVVRNLTGRLT